MRGRKRKPTALKVVEGNPGRRPLPENEPEVAPLVDTAAPAWLKGHARRFWVEYAGPLSEAGLLGGIDRPALEALAEAYGRWRTAQAAVARQGMVITLKSSGRIMANPRVGIAERAFDHFRTMLAEFGMTPAARSRVSVPDGTGNKEKPKGADRFFG